MQMSRRSGSAAAPRSPFLPLNFFFFFLLFSLWLLYLFVVVEFFSFPCRTTLEMFQLDQFDELESSWLNFFLSELEVNRERHSTCKCFHLRNFPPRILSDSLGFFFLDWWPPPPAQGRLILRNQSDKRRFRINGAGGLSQLRPPFLEIPCHFLLPFASIFGDSSPSLPSLPSPNLEIYIIEAISIEFPQCLFVLFLLLLLLLFFFIESIWDSSGFSSGAQGFCVLDSVRWQRR